MATKSLIYRVEGDLGPRIDFEHQGLDATGLTITARFLKPNGERYDRVATIDDVGPPALYHVEFLAGDLTEGDQEFDVFLSGGTIDDFSYPPRAKIVMRVRASG